MTRPYRVLPSAEFDLRYNYRFIADDNPAAADRWFAKIRKLLEMLARQPFIGELRDELQPSLRSFPCGNDMIYYRPRSGEPPVEIVRILHGARDVDSILGSDEPDEEVR